MTRNVARKAPRMGCGRAWGGATCPATRGPGLDSAWAVGRVRELRFQFVVCRVAQGAEELLTHLFLCMCQCVCVTVVSGRARGVYCAVNYCVTGLISDSLRILLNHALPGNVRR